MGGFALNAESLEQTQKILTLTPDGIVFLARHGHFCQIERSTIQDKSKADVLAKGLACVQIAWAICQALERKITNYPLTLLEVHTVVHVICALIMYAMWLQKPLNVSDPTIIDLNNDEEILAILLERDLHRYDSLAWYNISQPVHANIETISIPGFLDIESRADDLENIRNRPEMHPLHSFSPEMSDDITTNFCIEERNSNGGVSWRTMGPIDKYGYRDLASKDDAVCELYSGQTLFRSIGPSIPTGKFDYASELHPFPLNGHYIGVFGQFQRINRIYLSAKDVKRWKLVIKWVSEHRSLTPSNSSSERVRDFFKSNENVSLPLHDLLCGIISSEFTYSPLTDGNRKLLVKGAHNLNISLHGIENSNLDDSSTISSLAPAGTSIGITSAVYGGIHLAAMNSVFPTTAEKLLWRIACLVLIGWAIVFLSLALLFWFDTAVAMARTNWKAKAGKMRHSDLQGCKPVNSLFGLVGQATIKWQPFWEGVDDFLFKPQPERRVKKCLAWMGIAVLLPVYVPLLLTMAACGAAYVFSRVYIIVESFISLRHVPIGVYETPNLNIASYIPHT